MAVTLAGKLHRMADAKAAHLMQLTHWRRVTPGNIEWVWRYALEVKRDPARTVMVVMNDTDDRVAVFVNRVAGGYDTL